MRVLALDLSSHCGWAVMDEAKGGEKTLVDSGVIHTSQPVKSMSYPFGYAFLAERHVSTIWGLTVEHFTPDIIVTEQVNLGRDRYAQIFLGHLHYLLTAKVKSCFGSKAESGFIYYNSSEWRKALEMRMSSEQKKANRLVKLAGKDKASLRASGIRGKTTPKHLSVQWAKRYKPDLKQKDNDEADAINMAEAYFRGALPCDGKAR